MAKLILGKVNFRANTIVRAREPLYIMKRSIHQEDIAILNVYVQNNTAVKCVKQRLIKLKGEEDKSIIVIGDFHTLFTT